VTSGPPAAGATGRRERYVDVPGGRVWTARHGAADGPVLLVLHGGPGMPSYYLEDLAALADERQVVLFDQLGCGRSERPDDPALWTVRRAVAEVEAVRAALDAARVDIIGHSWGGFLALAYAAAHPGRVGALVLSSPLVSVARWVEDSATLVAQLPEPAQQAIRRCEADGSFDDPAYVAATDLFNRRFLCALDPWPAGLQQTVAETGEQVYRSMWGPSEFTQDGSLRGCDLSDTLPHLAVPSLWIGGSRDEVRPETLARFADAADGELVVLDGGTHCAHLEQPQAYLDAVRGFLRGRAG
jgi:proline iminopeptidase